MATPCFLRTPFAWIFWAGLVAITAPSCCTKVDCAVSPPYLEVRLYNFPPADVDTVLVKQYPKGTTAPNAVDSFRFLDLRGKDSVHFSLQNPTLYAYDYHFKIGGRLYVLTGFEVRHEEYSCNSCFLAKPSSASYDVLNAYQLNGQRQAGGAIQIYK